ncbi:MAG: carboxypeptidase regulatory-like domain-containing protein [Myxococcaceae bacterium]|nr:MAG: carboxypeptidase regulatory-like domain-containing protein [Myxococcaceae bacterium]
MDSSAEPLRLVMERPGRIRGRVVDPGGKAVTAFRLKGAYLQYSEQPAEWPDGAFELPFDTEGRVTLTVEAPGFMPLERPVNLTEGVDLDLGVLTLDPGWALRLALHDAETGEVLSHLEALQATLTHPSDTDIAREFARPRIPTLRDGVYTLAQLPPPPFTLTFRSQQSRPFHQEVTARVDTLSVAVDRGAMVRLRAQDLNGKALPAVISLRDVGPVPAARHEAFSTAGTVVFRGVEPGEYLLTARPPEPDEVPHFTPRRIRIPPRGEVTFTVEAESP